MAEQQIQNPSLTPNSLNIECSGGYVTAISGIPINGGGTIIGEKYYGDGINIQIDTPNNIIHLTQIANEKLNRTIPSKVSDLTDSANYATNTNLQKVSAGVDYVSGQLDTNYYTKDETSGKDQISAKFSVYQAELVGIKSDINNKQTKLTFKYNSNGEISAFGPVQQTSAIAGGLTGDYYSASNPSGFVNATQVNEQIVAKQYLTEASGNALYIPIPDGLSDNQYYAYTTSSWKVIQGAGDVSGISTVAHDDTLTGNGNQEALGVALSAIQSKLSDAQIQNISDVTVLKTASSTWDNVSAKLNTSDFNTYTATTAPNTYQPIGNYLSSNALDGYATQQWVGQQGYITQETDWTNTIQEASAKAYNDATANANSLYQTKGDYVKNTDISLDANNKVTAISGKELIITAHQSLTNYYTKDETSGATQLSTEFGKYLTKTIADGYYYPLSTNPSNYATSAGLTQSKQYAMTTTGWAEVQAGTSFTGVTTASPITGDGLNNSLGLDSNYKTAIEQVSGKVDKPADMTSNTPYCFSGGQWADITQTYYSKTEATGTFLQKNLTNTLSGDGTSSNTLGVNWSNLSSNLINSANTASNAWISGTEFSSFAQIKTAIDSKQSAGDYLPTSGGTVSGQLEVHGGSNFDTQFIKLTREGNSCGARIGLGNDTTNGTLALKTFNAQGQNTVQVNVKYNTNNNELIQVQKGGSDVGFLIPAVTATTTAGLTDDGILHIILES